MGAVAGPPIAPRWRLPEHRAAKADAAKPPADGAAPPGAHVLAADARSHTRAASLPLSGEWGLAMGLAFCFLPTPAIRAQATRRFPLAPAAEEQRGRRRRRRRRNRVQVGGTWTWEIPSFLSVLANARR